MPIGSLPHPQVAHLHARVSAHCCGTELAAASRRFTLAHYLCARAGICNFVERAARAPGQVFGTLQKGQSEPTAHSVNFEARVINKISWTFERLSLEHK